MDGQPPEHEHEHEQEQDHPPANCDPEQRSVPPPYRRLSDADAAILDRWFEHGPIQGLTPAPPDADLENEPGDPAQRNAAGQGPPSPSSSPSLSRRDAPIAAGPLDQADQCARPARPDRPGRSDAPGRSASPADVSSALNAPDRRIRKNEARQPHENLEANANEDGRLRERRLRAILSLLALDPAPGLKSESKSKSKSESESEPESDVETGHADPLVEATMARVREAQQRKAFARQVEALSGGSGRGFGFTWRQLGAAAAILLIGLSLIWPIATRSRRDASQITSAANLAAAGEAFGRYGADHDQALPRYPVQPGDAWWRVGQAAPREGRVRSNSAHLFLLIRGRYLHPDKLACPTNPYANAGLDPAGFDWPDPRAVSYSYQNQYTPEVLTLEDCRRLGILANRNPLFEIRVRRTEDGAARFVFRKDRPADTASDAFDNRGQHVLFGDGTVAWREKPIMPNGDNIWLVTGQQDAYDGDESPADANDSFLVP